MFVAWRYELTPEGIVPDEDTLLAAANASDTTLVVRGGQSPIHVTWQDGGEQRHEVFTTSFIIGRDPKCEVRLNNRGGEPAAREGKTPA